MSLSFEPQSIFHCNAKPLALGLRFGLYPQHETFALSKPTCWYSKSSRYQREPPLTQREAPLTQCEPPQPQRKPVEYSTGRALLRWHRIGHVDFMLFVSITFVLGTQREPGFWWNMGFRKPCHMSNLRKGDLALFILRLGPTLLQW